MYSIYSLQTDDGSFYIGSSKNVQRRFYQHRRRARIGNKSNDLYEKIRNGSEIKLNVLEELPLSTLKEDVLRREREAILAFRGNGCDVLNKNLPLRQSGSVEKYYLFHRLYLARKAKRSINETSS